MNTRWPFTELVSFFESVSLDNTTSNLFVLHLERRLACTSDRGFAAHAECTGRRDRRTRITPKEASFKRCGYTQLADKMCASNSNASICSDLSVYNRHDHRDYTTVSRTSSHINIHFVDVIIPLHILFLDQTLNALLDHAHVRRKVFDHRIDCRVDKLLVHHVLFRLHNAHDGGIEIVLAIAFDDALSLLRLLNLEIEG